MAPKLDNDIEAWIDSAIELHGHRYYGTVNVGAIELTKQLLAGDRDELAIACLAKAAAYGVRADEQFDQIYYRDIAPPEGSPEQNPDLRGRYLSALLAAAFRKVVSLSDEAWLSALNDNNQLKSISSSP